MKKVFFADKDDVLLFYSREFKKWAKTEHGLDLDLQKVTRSFTEQGVPEAWFTEFAHTPEYNRLKPMPGAVQAIRALSHSYQIKVVTSAPSDAVTRTAIYKNLEIFKEIDEIIFSSDKGKVAADFNAAYLVDDQLRFLEQIKAPCIPIAYSRPWNRSFDGLRGDWMQILHFVE
jgi:5'(3')-deoxyribonucleotidase